MLKRRVFTREFKVEAVALVSRESLSVAEAARRLEIGQNLLRKWQEQFAVEGSKAFAAKAQPSALEEENRRLRAENDRLRMEREILKKRRSSSRRSRDEIRLHPSTSARVADCDSVRGAAGVSQRVLFLAAASAERDRDEAGRVDSGSSGSASPEP